MAKKDQVVPPIGLLPLLSYKYDARRAIAPTRPPDPYFEEINARYRLWKPLWGIARFLDENGVECVGECGVLWSLMYDFCGGMMVSSAFAHTRNVADSSWGPLWRIFPYGQNERVSQARHDLLRADGYAKFRPLLPDLSVYTGKERHTRDEALEVLRQSVAGAIVTQAYMVSRRGVFAGDRIAEGRTRSIMAIAPTLPLVYSRLPGVAGWTGESYSDDEEESPARLRRIVPAGFPARVVPHNTTYHTGARYRNPNSGSDVSICWLTTVAGGMPPTAFPPGEALPTEEQQKYQNREFLDMCPQVMFHNG